MTCPVAYPVASSRTPRDTYGQAVFGAIRPVTDVPFCSSFSVSAEAEGTR
jgi:hypothetical protein